MNKYSTGRGLSMALVLAVLAIGAQYTLAVNKNRDSVWQRIESSEVRARGQRNLNPDKYQTYRLDQRQLKVTMAEMPLEFTQDAIDRSVILGIPMPDGSISRFRIERSNLLAEHLASAFPEWKTFQGYGLDDTSATGRFDWTSKGFHGYIFTSKGTIYIDPLQENDTQNYIVYFKSDYPRPAIGDFSCSVDGRLRKEVGLADLKFDLPVLPPWFTNGTNIRTFRLAIATTGEWSRGTTQSTDPQTVRTSALAALTTSANRLDGIFRRELAVTLQLVNPPIDNAATNIIYDDPATDPYDNTDSGAQLTLNQTTLNARVGIPNYDVGHLYGTGGGGVATSPAVCGTSKAQGYSAREGFYGDPFTVDYAAHELGHQFGADHTYNNSDPNGACTTRSATDAFEVASGSTIMSYVGICNQRNLQQYVDTLVPMFHIRSLTTIFAYIQNEEGNTCGIAGPNPNAIPTVNAGPSFTIPKLTPFKLTASGNDNDAGDIANLLYSWEQYDLAPSASGSQGTPANTYDVDTDGVLRPLFRTYSPVASNTRTFPSLYYILNPGGNNPAGSNNPPLDYTGTHPTGASGAVCEPNVTCVTGENLPSVSRTMNFRVAVRDQRGGVSDAATTVAVAGAAGPFVVTSQNSAAESGTPTVVQGGLSLNVTWDVAGTTANGINAANVKISLSTDGGQSFPTALSASTPNDGAEGVTLPNIGTTQARIKVEAVGNIFFDINNANFTITANPTNRRSPFDFDGDGKTDIAIFRPAPTGGEWWWQRSSDNQVPATPFGLATDVIAPGDFTGDGKLDITVWRPSTGFWYILRSEDNSFYGFPFGQNGDVPATADYDGDGRADPTVFRASVGQWYITRSSDNQVQAVQFGLPGDVSIAADFDGDGKADVAVRRNGPNGAEWWINRSTQGVIALIFGASTDLAVPGDYTGDGKADVAIFRPSTGFWFVLRSEDFSFFGFPFGSNGDMPVSGDYDGDGRIDPAVFRPSTNTWFIAGSTSGTQIQNFGIAGDRPIPNSFVR